MAGTTAITGRKAADILDVLDVLAVRDVRDVRDVLDTLADSDVGSKAMEMGEKLADSAGKAARTAAGVVGGAGTGARTAAGVGVAAKVPKVAAGVKAPKVAAVTELVAKAPKVAAGVKAPKAAAVTELVAKAPKVAAGVKAPKVAAVTELVAKAPKVAAGAGMAVKARRPLRTGAKAAGSMAVIRRLALPLSLGAIALTVLFIVRARKPKEHQTHQDISSSDGVTRRPLSDRTAEATGARVF